MATTAPRSRAPPGGAITAPATRFPASRLAGATGRATLRRSPQKLRYTRPLAIGAIMPQETVDLLINARWVIPVVPENSVYSDCAVVVDSSRIKGIYPRQEAERLYSARQRLDL